MQERHADAHDKPTTSRQPGQLWTLRLTITAGPSASSDTVEFSPSSSKVSVGRTRTADFQIKDPTVSEKHAQLVWERAAWVVYDLGSSNGTAVNGAPDLAEGKTEHASKTQVGRLYLRIHCRVMLRRGWAEVTTPGQNTVWHRQQCHRGGTVLQVVLAHS